MISELIFKRLCIVFKKGMRTLVKDGPKTAALKAFHRTRKLYQLGRFEKSYMGLSSLEDRFTAMYKISYWGGDQEGESFSGPGSTIEYTKVLRGELPKLLRQFSMRSVFDAPCGDFKWMKQVLNDCRDIDYIGADIIAPLIKVNIAKHANDRVKFLHLDLTNADFPKTDLMICRDCLFHLSYQDIKLVLHNYVQSGIPYLLTSTHLGPVQNRDISTGDFRLIDLFSEPFKFPQGSGVPYQRLDAAIPTA